MSLSLTLLVALLGQAPSPPSPDKPDDPAAWLPFIKKSLMSYEVGSLDDRKATYRLRAEPILRFTDPTGGVKHGVIFFWLGDDDRPVIATQVYLKPNGNWFQEFSLLTPNPLVATSADGLNWTPSRSSVEFKSMPGAPRPAQAVEPRLRQMHALAQEFAAENVIPPASRHQLRRLSKPLARYGKAGTDVIDGALFAYVLSTDPEVLLMLEARPGKDGPEWQYAFAPMTTRAVKCSRKGQEVWSLPRRIPESRNPTETFYVRQFPQEATEDLPKREEARP